MFPSEPFKWVQRLRGAGIRPPAGKYLAFEKDEAHVYEKKSTEARATDLAILEAWLQNKIEGSDIKMTNMQRKKQQQQQKKKQQEGGRRRRTVRHRRAARKTRRHARK